MVAETSHTYMYSVLMPACFLTCTLAHLSTFLSSPPPSLVAISSNTSGNRGMAAWRTICNLNEYTAVPCMYNLAITLSTTSTSIEEEKEKRAGNLFAAAEA